MTEPLVVVLARDVVLGQALRRLLRPEGFDVHPSESFADAARRHEQVVAVLVDARLLGEDGTDLPALRARFPGALLVAMAGHRDHPGLTAAVHEGALPLTADFDPAALADALRGGGGLAGVREPRRPRRPSGSAGAVLAVPLCEDRPAS